MKVAEAEPTGSCPHCSCRLMDSARFCSGCGALLDRCGSCQAALPSDARYCHLCGFTQSDRDRIPQQEASLLGDAAPATRVADECRIESSQRPESASEKLSSTCPGCGSPVAPNATRCGSCWKRLDDDDGPASRSDVHPMPGGFRRLLRNRVFMCVGAGAVIVAALVVFSRLDFDKSAPWGNVNGSGQGTRAARGALGSMSGRVAWRSAVPSEILNFDTASPRGGLLVTGDGNVLVVSAGGVAAFDSSGSLLWKTPLDLSREDGRWPSSAVSQTGGVVVVGPTSDSDAPSLTVICIDSSGTIAWQIDPRLTIGAFTCLVIATDGTIYVGGNATDEPGAFDRKTGAVVALSASGMELWRCTTKGVPTGLLLRPDGRVVTATLYSEGKAGAPPTVKASSLCVISPSGAVERDVPLQGCSIALPLAVGPGGEVHMLLQNGAGVDFATLSVQGAELSREARIFGDPFRAAVTSFAVDEAGGVFIPVWDRPTATGLRILSGAGRRDVSRFMADDSFTFEVPYPPIVGTDGAICVPVLGMKEALRDGKTVESFETNLVCLGNDLRRRWSLPISGGSDPVVTAAGSGGTIYLLAGEGRGASKSYFLRAVE